MGLLERFRRRPSVGIIATYNVVDNLGTVKLDSGDRVSFGLTGCREFQPAVGVRVFVEDVRHGHAYSVGRDLDAPGYEQALAARDATALSMPSTGHSPPPRAGVDAELQRRLGNVAVSGAMIRGGVGRDRVMLAINLGPDGQTISDDRPTMAFRFEPPVRTQADVWQFECRIDGATSYCRFVIEILLSEQPLLPGGPPESIDAPRFPIRFSKPADHERSPLARSAFLLAWRVDGGMEMPSIEGPLDIFFMVMGSGLTRLAHAYLPAPVGAPENWVLLRCERDEQRFWLALNLATGDGEVFPRRGDTESYTLALDFVKTFT